MIERSIFLWTSLLLVPLNSCKTTTVRMYPGDPRPSEEVARIEPWDNFNWLLGRGTRTSVLAVDGEEGRR